MSAQHEIRRWLDVVVSQLSQIDQRLENGTDELTLEGAIAYEFLFQTREQLTRGEMVIDEEVRRALDVFMLYRSSAFTPRAHQQTSCYQEVAESYTRSPRGQPYPSFYFEGGAIGPQLGSSSNPQPDLVITRYWYTHENGYLTWNAFVEDMNGVPSQQHTLWPHEAHRVPDPWWIRYFLRSTVDVGLGAFRFALSHEPPYY